MQLIFTRGTIHWTPIVIGMMIIVGGGLCLWEIGDKYSWLEDPWFDFASPLADATPYDDALELKPACDSMKRVLLSVKS